MPAAVIVPIIDILLNVLLCVVIAAEFKALDQFPVKDAVKGFDISILFRGSYMGELLLCLKLEKKLPDQVDNSVAVVPAISVMLCQSFR